MCCGIRCRYNWRAALAFTVATAPTGDCGVGLHHQNRPGPNLLGPIIYCWWQDASQSTAAAAAGALACTLLPWRFCALQKNRKKRFVFLQTQMLNPSFSDNGLIAERRESLVLPSVSGGAFKHHTCPPISSLTM